MGYLTEYSIIFGLAFHYVFMWCPVPIIRDETQGFITEWGFILLSGVHFKLEQGTANPLRVPTEVSFSRHECV